MSFSPFKKTVNVQKKHYDWFANQINNKSSNMATKYLATLNKFKQNKKRTIKSNKIEGFVSDTITYCSYNPETGNQDCYDEGTGEYLYTEYSGSDSSKLESNSGSEIEQITIIYLLKVLIDYDLENVTYEMINNDIVNYKQILNNINNQNKKLLSLNVDFTNDWRFPYEPTFGGYLNTMFEKINEGLNIFKNSIVEPIQPSEYVNSLKKIQSIINKFDILSAINKLTIDDHPENYGIKILSLLPFTTYAKLTDLVSIDLIKMLLLSQTGNIMVSEVVFKVPRNLVINTIVLIELFIHIFLSFIKNENYLREYVTLLLIDETHSILNSEYSNEDAILRASNVISQMEQIIDVETVTIDITNTMNWLMNNKDFLK